MQVDGQAPPLVLLGQQQIRHQRSQALLVDLDLQLRFPAHGGIAQVDREHRLVSVPDGGDRDLDRELRSVRLHREGLEPLAEQSMTPRGLVAGETDQSLLPQPGRNDQLQELAPEGVLATVSEDGLGSRVELDHPSMVIDGDHRVERGLEDGGLAGLGLPDPLDAALALQVLPDLAAHGRHELHLCVAWLADPAAEDPQDGANLAMHRHGQAEHPAQPDPLGLGFARESLIQGDVGNPERLAALPRRASAGWEHPRPQAILEPRHVDGRGGPELSTVRPALAGVDDPQLSDIPAQALAQHLQDRSHCFLQGLGLREDACDGVLQRQVRLGLLVLGDLDRSPQVATDAPAGGETRNPDLEDPAVLTILALQAILGRKESARTEGFVADPGAAVAILGVHGIEPALPVQLLHAASRELEPRAVGPPATRFGADDPDQDRAPLGHGAEAQPAAGSILRTLSVAPRRHARHRVRLLRKLCSQGLQFLQRPLEKGQGPR